MKRLQFKNMNTPAMATVMFAISNAVYYGISLIYTPIFARLLTQEEYGVVTLYGSWNGLLMMLCTLCVWQCAYNGFVDYKEEKQKFLSSSLLLSMCISGTALLVFALFPEKLSGLLGLPVSVTAFMFLNILFLPAYQLWAAQQRYAYRWRGLFWFAVVNALSTLVVGVWGVKAFPDSRAAAKIICSGILQTLIYLVLCVYLVVKGGKPRLAHWKYTLRFCLPLLPASIASSLLGSSDRIMVAKLQNDGAAALYGMAGNLSSIAYTVVTSSINVSWVPYIYQRMEAGEHEKLRRSSEFVVILVGLGCFALALVAPEAILVLGGSAYSASIWCVPALLMGIFYEFVSWLFTNIEGFYKRTEYMGGVTIGAAVVNLALNALFIPMFGFTAAAYTTWFSSVLMLLAHALLLRKVCRDAKLPNHVYNLRRLALLTVLFTAATLVVMVLYPLFWVRAAIGVAVLLLLVLKRKTILLHLKSIK